MSAILVFLVGLVFAVVGFAQNSDLAMVVGFLLVISALPLASMEFKIQDQYRGR